MYVNSPFGVVLGHNGNLTNAEQLKRELFRQDNAHRALAGAGHADEADRFVVRVGGHHGRGVGGFRALCPRCRRSPSAGARATVRAFQQCPEE